MDRDDILKKSREENKNGDEMEQKIKLRSYAFGAAVGCLLCTVLVFIEDILFNRSAPLLWIIYSGMLFSKSILDAIALKKRLDIILSIFWGLGFLAHIAIYIYDNIGL